MADKFKLSRKVKKIILGACIGGVVVLTAGLFTYIHIADTNTLGRKISIYGMDVSTLTADKAEQKLLDAFRSRKVQFKEGGSDVYQTTVSELGYDLDESALKSELTELQTTREANRKIFATQEDYKIAYQIQKDEEQEKKAEQEKAENAAKANEQKGQAATKTAVKAEAKKKPAANAKKTANWFMGEVLRLTKDKAMDAEQVSFSPKHLADLLVMVEKSEVSPQNAKKVFEKVFEEDIDPVVYIEEHGLKIVEDTGLLNDTLQKILEENPGPLEELLGGKEKVFGFFVGKMMRELKGKASPDAVREALVKEVEKRKNQ